jgi:hypothetical protein
MATYEVTYANHLNEAGETFEFPTDDFNSNGVELVTFDFVDSDIREGEDFARETWSYEVDDEDAGRFESGLERIDSAISWKRVE